MARRIRIVIGHATSHPESATFPEICEHKGIGHPDTLCDGVAEGVSRALCRAYLETYGRVQHYNVDKALLVGGKSRPRFGGGTLVTRPRLIVCGRATAIPRVDLATFVCDAARDYLRAALRVDPDTITLESAVRNGSPNLQQVVGNAASRPRANDTSFGAGFAPYSSLEQTVLKTAELLSSDAFRAAFPAAGDDYKVMGARIEDEPSITIALALIDQHVTSARQYFAIKAAMIRYLGDALGLRHRLVINALDDRDTTKESGLYLTVTGLSAEHGDDGQVGRGNRVNGLITPGRVMSLEAAAGKNSVAHVGKLYNVLAHRIAHAISNAEPALEEASVQLLSTIGRPVDAPTLVAIRLARRKGSRRPDANRIARLVRSELRRIPHLSRDLVEGRASVF